MEKIKYHYLKNREYINAILMNVLWVILMVCFASPHYEGNDDMALNKIAAGFFGTEYSEYLVFNNIIYGKFLKILYSVQPMVNWYGVVPYFLIFICFTALTYYFQKAYPLYEGILLSVAFLFLMSTDFYYEMQWTQNAGLFAATGMFMMYTAESVVHKKAYNWCGVLLATFGIWIRRDAFLSVAAIVVCSMIAEFVVEKKWKNSICKIISTYKYWIILGTIFILSVGINHYFYNSDSNWKYYMEYNEYRSEILDYGIPNYEECKQEYQEIGIDETDLQMLQNWTYADLNKFSLKTLKEINVIKKKYDDKKQMISEISKYIQNVINSMKKSDLVVIVLIALILALGCCKNKYKIVTVMLVALLELFYLSYRGRFLYRAYFSIWLMLLLLFILYFQNIYKYRLNKKNSIVCMVMLLVVYLPCEYDIFIDNSLDRVLKEQEDTNKWLIELAKDKDTLFLAEPLETKYPYTSSIFSYRKPSSNNVYFLGGWRCPSPITQQVLKKYNVEEEGIYNALLNPDKDVYYVVSEASIHHIERELNYIKKEYNKNIIYEKVDCVSGMNVYRFFELTDVKNINIKRDDKYSCFVDSAKFKDGELLLRGWAIAENIDPYKQSVYVRIINEGTKKEVIYYAPKYIRDDVKKVFGGIHDAASGFEFTCSDLTNLKKGTYKVQLIISDGEKFISNCENVMTFKID